MSLIKLHRRRSLLFLSLAAVAGALSISACSSEDNPPAGTLAVALTPASINVAPGGTGNSAATITRGGSFSGAVTLSQSGAPAGVTVTFVPALVGSGATASTINVAVGPAVAAGSYPVTISAEGDNVTTATATLTVVVVAGDGGSIALAAAPASLAVAAGAAAVTSTITITRTAPFAGAVGVTVSGAPAGVTASMNPVSVAAAGTTSTLSVSATASAVNGTYPLVVRGAGIGIADATVTVNAVVSGGATAGASFTFNPNPLPVTAGGAANTSTVTIARTGSFAPNGALNLVLSGAPAGLTATVAPNSNVTGTTATVTAQATGAVTAGTYNLTLTGTGTGIPNATATLPVVVSGGGGGGSVSFTFCAEDAPIWVAVQDGAGAWTRVNPTSGSTYAFSFPSGKGGVATVDTVGAGTDLSVIYGTLAEFTAATGAINNGGCSSNKTVNGSVSGVGATELASVTLGTSGAFVIPAVSTNFVLNNVPAGPQDLVATRTDATTAVNWVILRRGLNQANNSTLPVLAFGTEGFAPASANVTVTGLGSDTAAVVSLFSGVRGSSFAFLSSIADVISTTPPQAFAAIPAGNLQANELQQLLAFANELNNPNSDRTAGLYFTTVSNRTVALGPKLSTPTVSKVVTGVNARPNVLLVSQAQYNRLFSADFEQTSLNRTASVAATAGYFGALPGTWNVTLPDLSAAAGWSTNWGLANGTPIDWTVSAQGGAIPFLDATISDGSATQSASIQSAAPLALRTLRSGDDPFAMRRRLLEVLGARNRNPFE